MRCISATGRHPIVGGLAALILGTSLSACRQEAKSYPEQPNDSGQPLVCEGPNPAPATLRLLTRTQYNNTLLDLLGDDTAPASDFPPEHRVENFENNAETHQANPLLVEKYWAAARDISARTVAQRLDTVAPCPSGDTATCLVDFITNFGKRAFRRPLLPEEVESFRKLYDKAAPTLGHEASIGLVLEAMLQAPQFLYRVEAPKAPTPETGAIALGNYEIASRLSYFLWNSMPDDELFRAADAGELMLADQVEAQARRMLASPRARAMVSDFHRQWLDLDRFDGLARDGSSVTDMGALADSWKNSLLTFVDFVYWGGSGSMEELFSSDLIFVNSTLANLYQLSNSEDHFVGVAQPGQRAGLLTQPALMALLSHADQSSPIQRGVFIRAQLLCDPPQPPPPTVDNNPPDPDPSLTTRERFAVHTEEPVCATCHELIDPLGFGLENYDQFGRYRSMENGLPVDASGAIVDSPDPTIDGPFTEPFELSARLAQSAAVRDCLATHWYRFAMGRVEQPDDSCSLDQARTRFAESGGDLKELLVAITLTDAFRYRPAMPEGQ